MNRATPDTAFAKGLVDSLAQDERSEFRYLLAFEQCGSTMEEAAHYLSNEEELIKVASSSRQETSSAKLIVVAKEQTAGRGREGRRWVSAPASGIWATFAFEFDSAATSLAGLSLAVGAGICCELEKLGIAAQLKWPNDIVIVDHNSHSFSKLGGILIESTLRQSDVSNVRIGVGLNLISAQSNDFSSIGLSELSTSPLTYEQCFTALAAAVNLTWNTFVTDGFSSFIPSWLEYSMMLGRSVSFSENGELIQAVVKGIAADGALTVELLNKRELNIQSGEVKIIDAPSN